MKKTLACVTTLALSTLMLPGTALSAFAADASETEALAVIATNYDIVYSGYEVLLENGCRLSNEEIQTYLGEDAKLKYGDVVSVHNTDIHDSSYPYHYMLDEDSEIVYLGTVETYYADSIKELTVTRTFHGALDFTDADGVIYQWEPKSYFYENYGYRTPEGFDPAAYRAYRVGDVVKCAVRSGEDIGNQVIQPITPASNPVPVPAAVNAITVIGTDKDGAFLSNGVYVSNKAFQKYSGTDRILQYGDVLVEKGSYSIAECFPAFYVGQDDFQLMYLGTAEEYYAGSLKELTVVKAGDSLALEDADGTVYCFTSADIILENFSVPEGMSVSAYQVGDVVTCALKYSMTYSKDLIELPLTPAPEHTPIKGDIDCNGTVNIMDVILLNRNLMVGAEISEQGMKNALTYTANDGIATQSDVQRLPDSVDALNILKYIVGLTAEL